MVTDGKQHFPCDGSIPAVTILKNKPTKGVPPHERESHPRKENAMRFFKNFDTGDIWAEDEILSGYNSNYELAERFQTFDNYLDHLLDLGMHHIGGLVEIESPYIDEVITNL